MKLSIVVPVDADTVAVQSAMDDLVECGFSCSTLAPYQESLRRRFEHGVIGAQEIPAQLFELFAELSFGVFVFIAHD
ncbi:hypothetical protein [Adlercreutzia equolifaciens]|uniref:hypothetical protein n=1 Tax=Adlercreutzia equolifaciens TaxID=446660 RepID=UPI001EDCEE14|nr:hypothetical protein [uncultured Adlercreutzia sp.]MCG4824936.1 hypothetical protein [Adlercreutzia equolifaciens]MDR3995842.1 hypothetical protein [Adlercreutzia sp.]MEE0346679.1 hypothetical protein [Adlercreutzia sp.]MEE0582689.1 hypothetical protein [Adlercreutzia sp.]